MKISRLLLLLTALPFFLQASPTHPQLLFTPSQLQEMKQGLDSVPLFAQSVQEIIDKAAEAVKTPVEVPVPCDGGGGPVHEKHKSNYYEMMDCGVAYQFTGDTVYANHVAKMLDAYADLYPTLDYHQLGLSPVPGRLFWQTLNESVWLVHTAIAYDCVRSTLTPLQRQKIENNLLVPMAQFIMTGTADNQANLATFNKMHNHGTWATAAVGMAGLAMDNNELVDKALYGTDLTGEHGGFLQQMDELFSPDGYFTEGAYYQRYALWPFVIFAHCINNRRPELDIFNRRDAILSKAFDTLFQLSYDGEFMHINDALEKGLSAQEMVYAANILYASEPENEALPYIARNFHTYFIPCIGGYNLAKAVEQGRGQQPAYRTTLLRDGRDGNDGGIGIIRHNTDGENTALTLKATSHGLSHGHYDKLTIAFYDNGKEILPDYGASRFVNLEAKHSGHYTRENDTFCKQSIAHNTLVVDSTTHFGGKYKVSSRHHPVFVNFIGDGSQPFRALTARDTCAYADKQVDMTRTLVYTLLPGMDFPVALDLWQVKAPGSHNYDLPYWYRGHMVSTNVPREASTTTLSTLGNGHGYQHIWRDATCSGAQDKPLQFTFLNGNRLYTITSASTAHLNGTMMHAGANDPDVNLRQETAWMISAPDAADCLIASVVEPHGHYDLVMETAQGTKSQVSDLRIAAGTPQATAVELTYGPDNSKALFLVAADSDPQATHTLVVDGNTHTWSGQYHIDTK